MFAAFALGACAADVDDEAAEALEAHSLGAAAPRVYTNYIALGDSYSSGVGAPASTRDRTCGRSDSAWPLLLQPVLPSKPALTFKACSGATTLNVLPVGTPVAGPEPINRVDDPIPQITALQTARDPANTLVTITIGGNDAQVSTIMAQCLARNLTVCNATTIARRLTDVVAPRLEQTFRALKKAGRGADIVAVGYPYLVAAPKKRCSATIGLVPDNIRTVIRDGIDQANAAIKKAAENAQIHSITKEVRDEFAGNEACSLSTDFINTITVPRGASIAGAFHPNVAGNQAYARAVRRGLMTLGLIATQPITTQRSVSDAPAATLPANDLPPGQTSTVPPPEMSAVGGPSADPSAAHAPTGPAGNAPAGEKPVGDDSTGGATSDAPVGDEPVDDRAAGADAVGDESADDQSADDDAATDDAANDDAADDDAASDAPGDDTQDEAAADNDAQEDDGPSEDDAQDDGAQDDGAQDDDALGDDTGETVSDDALADETSESEPEWYVR
jgi:lysophospholipase L1-like esterase